MANAIFKGDLAEVSFGKEVGINFGNAEITHTTKGTDTSVLTIASGHYLYQLIPDNMLVGARLRITGGTNFGSDDFSATGRVYYVIANDTTAATITVQPALATAGSTAFSTADSATLDSFRIPTPDPAMSDTGNNHRMMTDQFIGLLNEFTLPEPEIDVRRQHVIGLGRDVNVITSGRETLSGGSIQLNAHTLRWMKYALGGHSSKSVGEFSSVNSFSGQTVVGALPLNIATGSNAARVVKVSNGNSAAVTGISTLTVTGLSSISGGADGDIVMIGGDVASTTSDQVTLDTTAIFAEKPLTGGVLKVISNGAPLLASYATLNASSHVIDGIADIDSGAATAALSSGATLYVMPVPAAAVTEGDNRIEVSSTSAGKFTAGDYIQIFDKDTHIIPSQDATPATIQKHEIRRVIAVDSPYLYVDEPFTFAHTATSCGIERLQYSTDSARGSPHINGTTKELVHGVEHTIFGHTTVPSFAIEQSFRSTDASPGGDQLLRIYSGCKVNTMEVSADTEGELKLNSAYEASRHYTDTGSRFNPHRMFDNTANSASNRKVSGIAVDGEKPYLFQDISIEAFGRPILRGTQFNFGIANNNTARWFIRGHQGTTSDTDQVQHGATQFPMDITEAQREYTFTFDAMVEDDRLWEQVRTRKHHKNTNDITLTLTKPGSASTRQRATITIEDYTIIKADHQIPSDKGPIIANVELVIRHLKVTEHSPYYSL
jgi:hypothetical protein